jgi:hypothetical protein
MLSWLHMVVHSRRHDFVPSSVVRVVGTLKCAAHPDRTASLHVAGLHVFERPHFQPSGGPVNTDE